MLPAPAWYLAHDSDAAGDKAAEGWPARAVRVRPPGPYKDWTDASKDGVHLRRWWTNRLGGPRLRRCSRGMSYRPGDGVMGVRRVMVTLNLRLRKPPIKAKTSCGPANTRMHTNSSNAACAGGE
jgi:hypothetical protein